MRQVAIALTLCASIAATFAYDPAAYGSAYDRTDEKRDFYNLLETLAYIFIKIGDENAPPHYEYEYKVHDPHTGDIKSQAEQRQGDAVRGYYTLREADGTLREVHYTADKHNGFQAEVKRTGQGYHPHYSQKGTYSY